VAHGLDTPYRVEIKKARRKAGLGGCGSERLSLGIIEL
jgi:hypothetical protein